MNNWTASAYLVAIFAWYTFVYYIPAIRRRLQQAARIRARIRILGELAECSFHPCILTPAEQQRTGHRGQTPDQWYTTRRDDFLDQRRNHLPTIAEFVKEFGNAPQLTRDHAARLATKRLRAQMRADDRRVSARSRPA